MRLVISNIHHSAFSIINERKLLHMDINKSLEDFTQSGYDYVGKFLNYTVYGTMESPIDGILE